jgi:hypothetical protein
MSLMQVKVNVHESVVKKVKAGQRAKVRVDAFPNDTLTGTVKNVSQLADSSSSWRRGGVKEYTTIVTLDDASQIDIKPGMTAEVEILVDNLRDVIAIPVQAVTEHKHQHFVYIKKGSGFERTPVEIGQSNNRMVEVKSGIEEGVDVALDARARGIADFEDDTIDVEVDTDSDADAEADAAEADAIEANAIESGPDGSKAANGEEVDSEEVGSEALNSEDAPAEKATAKGAAVAEVENEEAADSEQTESDDQPSDDESAFPPADTGSLSTEAAAAPVSE